MGLDLVPLCTAELTLERPLRVKDAPFGMRFSIGIVEGTFKGDRLSGTLTGPGGDFLVMGANGVGELHVHAQIKTDDDALVYVHYSGRQNLSEGTGAPLYVAPLFETGDERYAWLNHVQAVGKGSLQGASLTYEWFEVR